MILRTNSDEQNLKEFMALLKQEMKGSLSIDDGTEVSTYRPTYFKDIGDKAQVDINGVVFKIQVTIGE